MTKDRVKAFCTGLFLCFAAAGLTACGSNDEDSTDGAVVGRLTSASDTQIVVEVFEEREGGRPDIASGSAARGNTASGSAAGMDGQPPEDGKEPSGEKPDGTPPADDQKGKDRGGKAGETKTYRIDSDTVIYKMSGDEKTEISIEEVDLGSMLSIVAEDDKAASITVQDMSDRKGRGQGEADDREDGEQ